jgi:hypothetical protein
MACKRLILYGLRHSPQWNGKIGFFALSPSSHVFSMRYTGKMAHKTALNGFLRHFLT